MTDRVAVSRWLAGYEAAWRTPGTDPLAGLFTDGASYRQSPYQAPVVGLDAIRRMWDEERAGPDEVFTLATEILAVDWPIAVVRAEVRYGDPVSQEYRDLWVMRLDGGGRCTWFEEWPFWPERPYAAGSSLSRCVPAGQAGPGGVLQQAPQGLDVLALGGLGSDRDPHRPGTVQQGRGQQGGA